MLNVEWPILHESILQKRRNEIKKKKLDIGNAAANAVLEAMEREHFDDLFSVAT